MDERTKILETDLYRPVRNYLEEQGYTVHSEVKGCDITAVKGEDLVVVELKISFNLKLLAQAVKRQRVADSVYVAVPRPRGGKRTEAWRNMCILLRRLEIGLIIVNLGGEKADVEIISHPNTFDRLKSARTGKRQRRSIIKEVESRYGDYNEGGSTRRKLVTAYRQNSIHIACCIARYGELSPAQLKKMGTGSKTQSILSKNFYGWFERISKGKYGINSGALEFMRNYPELVQHYEQLVESFQPETEG